MEKPTRMKMTKGNSYPRPKPRLELVPLQRPNAKRTIQEMGKQRSRKLRPVPRVCWISCSCMTVKGVEDEDDLWETGGNGEHDKDVKGGGSCQLR